MAFDASRLHPTLLDAVPFAARWRALAEPAEGAEVDVRDVGVRMAMYRALIERTNPRGAMGRHDELHPMWGYASQLAWQERSGRLGNGARIATDSWWGGCNYALSVVPYWSAMRAGLVPKLSFPDPNLHYQMAVVSWETAVRMMADYVHDADLEPLRLEVWRAHLHGIDAAVREHVSLHNALPMPEKRFARGWVRMVELFAAAGWRTDLEVVARGAALPSRVLRTDDDVAALPPAERAMAARVIGLGDRTPWRWPVELAMWRRMMRERAERADAERILAALFGKGDDVWGTRWRALQAAARRTPGGRAPRDPQ